MVDVAEQTTCCYFDYTSDIKETSASSVESLTVDEKSSSSTATRNVNQKGKYCG